MVQRNRTCGPEEQREMQSVIQDGSSMAEDIDSDLAMQGSRELCQGGELESKNGEHLL